MPSMIRQKILPNPLHHLSYIPSGQTEAVPLAQLGGSGASLPSMI
jgi:hypothetical protein